MITALESYSTAAAAAAAEQEPIKPKLAMRRIPIQEPGMFAYSHKTEKFRYVCFEICRLVYIGMYQVQYREKLISKFYLCIGNPIIIHIFKLTNLGF